MQYLFIYIYRLLLLTHYLSLIFLRAWQKFIAEKEGEFKTQLHSILIIRYVIQITTSNLRKFKFITLIFHNIFS
jgi:hypothetical protein